MASAADSGFETGNESNDSTIQDKIVKNMVLENSMKKMAQEIDFSSLVFSKEDLMKAHSSTDVVLQVRESISQLYPTSLVHGYEYHATHPSHDTAFALSFRPSRDIGGVFVSGGPLGIQYKGNELVRKLRHPAHRIHHFRCLRHRDPSDYFRVKEAIRMRRAAGQNDTEAMRQMLESGMSPNVSDDYRRTPLHMAACMGYADMVKLLLDFGADPNAKDRIGNTPLHLAACTNSVPVITLLLKAGTHISSTNSPLQLAITKFNIIKRSAMPHPVLKEQVAQVISMLTEYMRRKEAPSLDAELLNKFESLVRVSDSSEQVESGICDLLTNLSALDISSSS